MLKVLVRFGYFHELVLDPHELVAERRYQIPEIWIQNRLDCVMLDSQIRSIRDIKVGPCRVGPKPTLTSLVLVDLPG